MKLNKNLWIIGLLLIIIVQIFLRLHFEKIINSDEDIYGYFAQGIIKGEVPYRDMFDHKVPAIFFIYALIFKIFGESLLAIHLSALLLSLLTTLIIFKIAQKIWNTKAGVFTALLYAVFSSGPYIEGSTANTEIFVNFFSSLSLWLFILANNKFNNKNTNFLLLSSGLLAGLSFMTKPVAIFNFLALIVFSLAFKKYDFKKIFPLFCGFLFFPIIFSAYFFINNIFPQYLYSAFLINKDYISGGNPLVLNLKNALIKGAGNTLLIALAENSVLWLFAFEGIFYIFKKDKTTENLFFVIYFIFLWLGVATGGAYLAHYYIQIIPALSLLGGYFLKWVFNGERFKKNKLFFKSTAVLILLFLIIQIFVLQKYGPLSKFLYITDNYHKDIYLIGSELKKQTTPNDHIFVWSNTAGIYFFAQRRSASKFIFYPAWAEEKLNIKENILADLEKNKPSFIIIDPPSNDQSFEKLDNFLLKNYKLQENYLSQSLFYQWKIFKRS